jgi:hypothetical protein
MYCHKDFKEKELELSHNVPKYLGGSDADGRMWLCKKHHDDYENLILWNCYKRCFGEEIEIGKDRRTRIFYMNKIKVKCKYNCIEFIKKINKSWRKEL